MSDVDPLEADPNAPPGGQMVPPVVHPVNPSAAEIAAEIAAAIRMATESRTSDSETPETPLMGGVMTVNGRSVAWCGGVPRPDWTGLAEKPEAITAGMFRATDIRTAQSSFKSRITGEENKFKAGDDIREFERKVSEHSQMFGFSPIGYLRDPRDETKSLNVVTHHSVFVDPDSLKKSISEVVAKYDAMDRANTDEKIKYFYNSIDETLATEVRSLVPDKTSFLEVWFAFISIVHAVSLTYGERIKSEIKSLKPQSYAGQDITIMATQYRLKALELTRIGQLESSLIKDMLLSFLSANSSSDTTDIYRHELLTMQTKLETALLRTSHLSQDDRIKYLNANSINYTHICDAATKNYRTMVNDKLWEPAKTTSDKRGVPRRFAYSVVANDSRRCFNCNSPDHFARDCPEPKKPMEQRRGNFQKGPSGKPIHGRHRSNNPKRHAGKMPSRRQAPKPGESEVQDIQGKKFYWCAKCGRWSTTHGTATHTGKRETPANKPETNHQANFAYDHYAWMAEFPVGPTSWTSMISAFTVPATGILLGLSLPYLPTSWILAPLGWLLALLLFWATKHSIGQNVAVAARLTPSQYPRYFRRSGNKFRKHRNRALALLPSDRVSREMEQHFRQFPPTVSGKPRRVKRAMMQTWQAKAVSPTFDPSNLEKFDKTALDDFDQQIVFKRHSLSGTKQTPLEREKRTRKHKKQRKPPDKSSPPQPCECSCCFPTHFPKTPTTPTVDCFGNASINQMPMRPHDAHLMPEHFDELFDPRKFAPSTTLRSETQVETSIPMTDTEDHSRMVDCGVDSPFSKVDCGVASLGSYVAIPNFSLTAALKAAFTHPRAAVDNNVNKENRFPVIWDSGASISVTCSPHDFIQPPEPAPSNMRLHGLKGSTQVKGKGEIAWAFEDDKGILRTLHLPALWVPESNVRLLSTSNLLTSYPDEKIMIEARKLKLSGAKAKGNELERGSITVSLQNGTNLPVKEAYSVQAAPQIHRALNAAVTTTINTNMNLSPAQRELLKWHHRLAHLSMRSVQFIMRLGVLSHSEATRQLHTQATKSSTQPPMCAACQFAKQRQRSKPGLKSTVVRERQGAIRTGDLLPGQKVSVDHFHCSTRGRLFHTQGREEEKKQFMGGAIFVDHASSYIFVREQVNLNTHETIVAKNAFELHCRDSGIVVQSYLSDNGAVFTSKQYHDHLEAFQQTAQFAGVGAHHHNGIAERGIQTIMSLARAMMLHAAIHWPDVTDAKLWPCAVQHAVYIYNHTPMEKYNGLSPSDLFSKSRWPNSRFHDLHTWGCPVYVLEKRVHDGKKLPRWAARSDRQMYMGVSANHASTVPMCLNLETGSITPQYHVVFDDSFSTVHTDLTHLPELSTPEWDNLFGEGTHHYVVDDDDPNGDRPVYPDPDVVRANMDSDRVESAMDSIHPPESLAVEPPPQIPVQEEPKPSRATESFEQRESAQQREHSHPINGPSPSLDTVLHPAPVVNDSPVPPSPSPAPPSPQREKIAPLAPASDSVLAPTPPRAPIPVPTPSPSPLRRSTRIRRPPARFDDEGYLAVQRRDSLFAGADDYLPTEQLSLEDSTHLNRKRFLCFMMRDYPAVNLEIATAYYSYKAKLANSNPDILTWDQAMSIPQERKQWLEAAVREINDLENHDSWDEVPVGDAKEPIVPMTWTFVRKRRPDGSFKKFKGRTCVRGDLEEERPDTETYAPVVSWISVRLFLILALILGWTTVSIDFSNAFLHAKLPKPIWVHLPRGFRSTKGPGTCLRLKKSLYGTSVAPRLWFNCISEALKDFGFVQTTHDQCFFYKKDMMVVLYVDDAGIAAKNPEDIDELIRQLEEKQFSLTKEGSFEEFLGIQFEKSSEGEFTMTQTGLIDKILRTTKMEECKPNLLPTTQTALGSDVDGEKMNEEWSYSSVVGMLLYLSTNSRPDIAFAVSQVCRFSSAPKQSHAAAVKTIIRYLKGTRDKGTIFKPTKEIKVELYVDADFCSLHGTEDSRKPDAAKSRTGYIISICGCPTVWKSQLQTHISLSTLEAEYSALSYALKVFLPVKRLLQEMVEALEMPDDIVANVNATVFEDNQGALILAQNQRITNRTKYFLVKWHWFWQHAKEFVLKKITSEEQRADYFTKPLPRAAFENNRYLVQNW